MGRLVKYAALAAVAILLSTDSASAFGRRNGCNGCWGGWSGCYGGWGCHGGCWGGWRGCHGGCWGGCHGYWGGGHGGYHTMHAGPYSGGPEYTASYASWAAGGYGGLAYWSVPRVWYGAPYQSVTTAGVLNLGGPARAATRPSADRATLVLTVPEDAKLTINGAATMATSTQRVFESPALEPGRDYEYTVVAEVTRNGETRSATKVVIVRPGQETRETMQIPGIQIAGR